MFIDRTYFIGELNIPGTDKVSVQERLDLFIETHETLLLKDIFGYQFYKAFMNGLTGAPVAQIWTDLLQGAVFTGYNGRQEEWIGLVSQPLDIINAVDASNAITIIVGRGQTNDPVATQNTVKLPVSLIGKDFILEQRAIGRLRPDEYSIITVDAPNDTLRLNNGKIFTNDDTYFYKSATLALNTAVGTAKKSLIANYVYYQWMKNEVTQSVQLGEVAAKAENAQVVSPNAKMIRAYNEMVDYIQRLMYYLQRRRTDYTDWWSTQEQTTLNRYRKINQFGI